MNITLALASSFLLAVAPLMGMDYLAAEDAGETPELAASDVDALTGNACNAKPLEVIITGRENRFGLDGQQVALNPAIPMDRICNAVSKDCTQTCKAAAAAAVATGVKDFQDTDTDPVKLFKMGELADNFNASLGIETNFKALGNAAPPPAGGMCRARSTSAATPAARWF